MPRPPISAQTIDRFVELVALGLTTHEAARAEGAELLLRYQEQFDALDVERAEEALPEGVYLVYPRVPASDADVDT